MGRLSRMETSPVPVGTSMRGGEQSLSKKVGLITPVRGDLVKDSHTGKHPVGNRDAGVTGGGFPWIRSSVRVPQGIVMREETSKEDELRNSVTEHALKHAGLSNGDCPVNKKNENDETSCFLLEPRVTISLLAVHGEVERRGYGE